MLLFDDCRPQANDSIHSVVSSTPPHMVMSPLCRGAGWTRHACRLTTAVRHRRLSRESGRMEWMMISGSLLLLYIFEIVSVCASCFQLKSLANFAVNLEA